MLIYYPVNPLAKWTFGTVFIGTISRVGLSHFLTAWGKYNCQSGKWIWGKFSSKSYIIYIKKCNNSQKSGKRTCQSVLFVCLSFCLSVSVCLSVSSSTHKMKTFQNTNKSMKSHPTLNSIEWLTLWDCFGVRASEVKVIGSWYIKSVSNWQLYF